MMDPLSTYDDLPWELIISALQEKLGPEEEVLFRQWLNQYPDHRAQYEKLRSMWMEGLTDYVHYQKADANEAWNVLRQRISGGRVVEAFPEKRSLIPGRWMAAAILLLIVVSGLWYFSRQHSAMVYATTGEQKNLSLPDGSTMIIQPQTRIRVGRDYNKADRMVILDSGKAEFAVAHQAQLPFIVDVDVASIKDIGTTFTVQKTNERIQVTVSSGKIAFIQKATGESREVEAGHSLVYLTATGRFDETQPVGGEAGALRFSNTPLTAVVAVLQETFGKRITIADSVIGQKRLTADLNGVSFGDAVKIVCTSLDLEYSDKSGDILFKAKEHMTLTP